MPRLLHFFSPFFLCGLALEAALAAGRAPPAAQAQQQAHRLLEQARHGALAAGWPADQVESACFAAVAWIDELMTRHADWFGSQVRLQRTLFNATTASVEFFHHLAALPVEQAEVREVYWHALALGLAGPYYFERSEGGELDKLKNLHGLQLPVPPLALATLAQDYVTPQPYAMPDPPGRRLPGQRERALLRAALALVLLLPTAWLGWWWLGMPHESAPTLAQRVDRQLQTYACTDLHATVAADGRTQISGYVAESRQMALVEHEVTALPGVRLPRFDLQLRIWPYCEVEAILKPYRARNQSLHAGLTVSVPSARNGRLREGDAVRLRVLSPDRENYLWVDYYTADGSVLHFHAGHRQLRVRAGETVELGADIPSSWLVSPPFGVVMVTALASPVPFDEVADRPPYELASDYLLRLRETLAADKDGQRLIADYLFLQTIER